jgi:hypothetical protein
MLAIVDTPIVFGAIALGALFGILPIWFSWRALERTGLSGAVALLWLVPGGFLVVLGILAFAQWPRLPSE